MPEFTTAYPDSNVAPRGCVASSKYKPHLPKELYEWTVNACAGMLMGEFVLKEEHVILFHKAHVRRTPTGVFIVTEKSILEVGFAYPVSLHLVRAVEYVPKHSMKWRRSKNRKLDRFIFVPACRFHIGRYIFGSDGFEITGHWDQPRTSGGGGGNNTIRFAIALSFIKNQEKQKWKSEISKLMEEGFEYDLTMYRTPGIRPIAFYSLKYYYDGDPI